MKCASKIVFLLLMAALPFSLLAQGQTVIAAYMNVKTSTADYLEVEQAWKKIHQKAVDEGYMNGWQLWRKMHVGTDDPYQFITLHWYDDYKDSFGADVPSGWMQSVYTDEEWDALYDRTIQSRDYVKEEVSNLIVQVDNPQPVQFLVVHRMKVLPGMATAYVDMETEIFKPMHEALIEKGALAHWGLWNIWPYQEGQCRYVTVNGFKDLDQLTSDNPSISLEELGLDYTEDEIMEMVQKTRVMAEDELWVLVDSVFPEE